MAARAGFGRANDGVKVRCVTISPPGNKWCRDLDLNGEPIAYKAIALPLCYHGIAKVLIF